MLREPAFPWVVSTDLGASRVLATAPAEAVVLEDDAAAAVLAGVPVDHVLGRRPLEPERPRPKVIADIELRGGHETFVGADSLRDLLGPDAPPYVLVCQELAAALEVFAEAGDAATPVIVYGQKIIVGPTIRADGRPCGRCYTRRLLAAHPTMGERIRRGHRLVPTVDPDRALITAQTLFEAPRSAGIGCGLEICLDSGSVVPQAVIPLPACDCRADQPKLDLSALIGQSLGTVHAVRRVPDTGAFTVMIAAPPPLERGSFEASGTALDPEQARNAALGEAVERRASQSASRLAVVQPAEDQPELPLDVFRPYRHDQDVPFVRMEAGLEVPWLPAVRVQTQQDVLVPGCFVATDPRLQPPRLLPRVSTGNAAGPSWPAVVRSAVLELVERDLVTRCILNRALVRLDARRWAPREVAAAAGNGLDVDVAMAQSDLPVCVAIVRGVDRTNGSVALGFAAGADPSRVIAHAIAEAVQITARRRAQQTHGSGAGIDWEALPLAGESTFGRFDLDALVRRYDPLVADLTSAEADAVGLRVAGAWSDRAVDLPHAGAPIPERWFGEAVDDAVVVRWNALAEAIA